VTQQPDKAAARPIESTGTRSFAVGLFIATGLGRALSSRAERMVLRHVPGFMFFKSITRGLAGMEKDSDLAVVMAPTISQPPVDGLWMRHTRI
jgi:hypothetical protein